MSVVCVDANYGEGLVVTITNVTVWPVVWKCGNLGKDFWLRTKLRLLCECVQTSLRNVRPLVPVLLQPRADAICAIKVLM